MISGFRLERFQSENFRNLKNAVVEFGPEFNCIFGKNGNGKTNLLEAIHLCLNKKSFRKNTHFEQLLSTDSDRAHLYVQCLLRSDQDEQFLKQLSITSEKSEWKINGQPASKKLSTPTIFIGPFDSNNFYNRPADRRDWFDHYFSILDHDYSKLLSRYIKALKFRNTLLHRKPYDYTKQLSVIDEQFVENSIALTLLREKLISELLPFIKENYFSIFSDQAELKLKLKPNIHTTRPAEMHKLLQMAREKELILGHSTVGAHKDDYELIFNGWPALEYCSLGQLKMAYLALIFAYIELFRYKFSSFPLLIIDDVSGELDKERWGKLITYLSHCPFQVFITTANDAFKEELKNLKNANFFEVFEGEIKQIS